jgi:hypothetical protein
VGAAGDVNGDGYDDLVVGAPSSDIGSANLGAVYIFYGSASGVQTSTTNVISNPGGDASAFFGEAVYGVGDVNGDGFKDIMVAARSSDVSGANLGSVFIFYGSATGVQSLGYSTLSYPGSDANSGFGQTLGP